MMQFSPTWNKAMMQWCSFHQLGTMQWCNDAVFTNLDDAIIHYCNLVKTAILQYLIRNPAPPPGSALGWQRPSLPTARIGVVVQLKIYFEQDRGCRLGWNRLSADPRIRVRIRGSVCGSACFQENIYFWILRNSQCFWKIRSILKIPIFNNYNQTICEEHCLV